MYSKISRGSSKLSERSTEKLNSIITQSDSTCKTSNHPFLKYVEKIGPREPFLGEQSAKDKGKKTLVLDLDETLVHSSFQPIRNPDIVMPIEVENIKSTVYVLVRPGVNIFLE